MPTYEYECRKCGGVSEVFQSITAHPKRKLDCPTCGERTPVKRLLGAGAGVVFKGSGFYTTDYRSDGYKKAAKADQPATAKTDTATSSGTKTTKPEPTKAPAAAASD
jgi:putative FmdB family regulatory protein